MNARLNTRQLDEVCLDCQDFLEEIKGGCKNCPVARLKDRLILAVLVYIKKGIYPLAILDEEQDDWQITKQEITLKKATRFYRVMDENTDGQFIVRVGKKCFCIDGDDFESRIDKR